MPKSSTPITLQDRAQSILAVEACINKLGVRGLARALNTTTDEVYRWRKLGITVMAAIRADVVGVCPKETLRPDVSVVGWQREIYLALADGSLTVTGEGDLRLGTSAAKLAARERMRERRERIRSDEA